LSSSFLSLLSIIILQVYKSSTRPWWCRQWLLSSWFGSFDCRTSIRFVLLLLLLLLMMLMLLLLLLLLLLFVVDVDPHQQSWIELISTCTDDVQTKLWLVSLQQLFRWMMCHYYVVIAGKSFLAFLLLLMLFFYFILVVGTSV
jgi:hypothetical protein